MDVISMERERGKKRALSIVVEVVLCLMIAVVVVGLVQQFFLAPVAVTGSSMMPTIRSEGDKVYVQKKFFSIKRRDVVVFYRPNNDDVKSKNPANSISFADFFNSLPFVNKIPNLSEDSTVASDYTCVIKRVVGVPGDKVEIKYVSDKEAVLLVNDKVVNDIWFKHCDKPLLDKFIEAFRKVAKYHKDLLPINDTTPLIGQVAFTRRKN